MRGAKLPDCYRKPFTTVRCLDERLNEPMHWRKPKRVGVCFTGDLFDPAVPQWFVHDVLNTIAACPQHLFFMLTKRPDRAAAMDWTCTRFCMDFRNLPNLLIGTSIENEAAGDMRIPRLRKCPGRKWISMEPLTGSCDVFLGDITGLELVVIGGMSGPHSLPCHVEWIRQVIARCKEANVLVYVKQLGSNAWTNARGFRLSLRNRAGADMLEWDNDLRVRVLPAMPSPSALHP